MVYTDYNEELGRLEYNVNLERVIDLTDESECSKYGIRVSMSTFQDFEDEFQGFEKDVPYFEKPVEVKKKGRKSYQAIGGRIILTHVSKRKRVGVTKAKPVGWEHNFIVNKKNHFYHKTHILGDQLVKKRASYVRGENILGTRYLNTAPEGESMKTYEDKLKNKLLNHPNLKIYYRVIPIFRGEETVPRGVRMTAYTICDMCPQNSNCLEFDVFVFNIYPGYSINYSTGGVYIKRRLRFGASSHDYWSHRVNYLMTSIPKKRRLGFSAMKRKNTHENRR